MAADGEKKMITLKSSDGEEFEVEEVVAMESQTIRHMIEDDCADNGIPLPNVNSKILSKVIEYCNKHVLAAKPANGAAASGAAAAGDAPAPPAEDLKNWDAEFVKVDQATLFDLILLAVSTMVRLAAPTGLGEVREGAADCLGLRGWGAKGVLGGLGSWPADKLLSNHVFERSVFGII